MMSAEDSKQKEQTVTGKHAGTEDACNDIMKALLKPQGFPWYLNCCNILINVSGNRIFAVLFPQHAALQTVGTDTPSALKHL